jgi:hypothetical protein
MGRETFMMIQKDLDPEILLKLKLKNQIQTMIIRIYPTQQNKIPIENTKLYKRIQ